MKSIYLFIFTLPILFFGLLVSMNNEVLPKKYDFRSYQAKPQNHKAPALARSTPIHDYRFHPYLISRAGISLPVSEQLSTIEIKQEITSNQLEKFINKKILPLVFDEATLARIMDKYAHNQSVFVNPDTFSTVWKVYDVIESFENKHHSIHYPSLKYSRAFLAYLFQKSTSASKKDIPEKNNIKQALPYIIERSFPKDKNSNSISILKETLTSLIDEKNHQSSNHKKWRIRAFLNANLDEDKELRKALWKMAIDFHCHSNGSNDSFRYVHRKGLKWVDTQAEAHELITYAQSKRTSDETHNKNVDYIVKKLSELSNEIN